ncbi:ATP-dependent Clp protease ATP-binding subunit ClpA [Lactococcus lactis subsp. lactis]|uniref:ATP-dependent Clp protease ATP-binding subunit n=3 Tax=Lactococcus lactis TaxID=1358 RepID=A0A5M9PWV3_LACLH|nr:AAA family ATPase [Lactococcus lactis]KAA8700924.1 ATP-dependent Clp protease ATP-binding subunit [Lactococcus lactis subsp. hordniae]KSU05808.1 ATP-dependent Clp protease ATP-binding subunit ClpA [Lactococcus lactis subsp. lactis]MCT3135195.1 ATP-dependent Clp protease ATP-binding subunit [Lactococcus lactis]
MTEEIKTKTIKLSIPDDLEEKYNHALTELKMGENTLVGNEKKLEMLEVAMLNPETPNALILGGQGVGKTALVEQLLYNKSLTSRPMVAVTLSIEELGELPENIMISRMRSLLGDMNVIKYETEKLNNTTEFDICLFIDEVHKLSRYGYSQGSSGAMNALKEGTARGEFKLIASTTDYEYRQHIMTDPAFDRRFTKVILSEPNLSQVKMILKRRLEAWGERGIYIPKFNDEFIEYLIKQTDAFIRNQVNPAKSIAILSSVVSYCSNLRNKSGKEIEMNHTALKFVFEAEGYNLDSNSSAEDVKKFIKDSVKGQPLAIKYLTDLINTSYYTPRNLKSPLILAIFIGTTGTGKTVTAEALAKALFGREDAIVVVNGGDYSASDDALKAQHFIGDSVAVDKQQLILLDEIEKSHKNVINGYMRMIDKGIVLDSLGIERSINNTALVATSNLGAKVFGLLSETMKLNEIENPDEMSEQLINEWYKKETDVRNALLFGDDGLNNGIKPEFLERFSLFIPYLPLAKKTIATIARGKLLKFKADMLERGYKIQLPGTRTREQWEESGVHYEGVDSVSVMIAEDIINKEASTTGARAINRFIETHVKADVANAIAERIDSGEPTDGAFRISTNGQASFENSKLTRPDILVTYIPKNGKAGDFD